MTMQLYTTPPVNNRVADDVDFAKHVAQSIGRFIRNDWGETKDFDKNQNDEALETQMRLFASYGTGEDQIYIIKDAYDGPVTIMYPTDY